MASSATPSSSRSSRLCSVFQLQHLPHNSLQCLPQHCLPQTPLDGWCAQLNPKPQVWGTRLRLSYAHLPVCGLGLSDTHQPHPNPQTPDGLGLESHTLLLPLFQALRGVSASQRLVEDPIHMQGCKDFYQDNDVQPRVCSNADVCVKLTTRMPTCKSISLLNRPL